jgi:hypothetical protein
MRHAATAAPIRPWPRPWLTLAARVVAIPSPRSHRASAGTAVLRRAESNTVSGTMRAVQPDSPCAR